MLTARKSRLDITVSLIHGCKPHVPGPDLLMKKCAGLIVHADTPCAI